MAEWRRRRLLGLGPPLATTDGSLSVPFNGSKGVGPRPVPGGVPARFPGGAALSRDRPIFRLALSYRPQCGSRLFAKPRPGTETLSGCRAVSRLAGSRYLL